MVSKIWDNTISSMMTSNSDRNVTYTFSTTTHFANCFVCTLGPDRLELIIFDITGKKIDNHRSHLIIEFSSVMLLSAKGLRVCLIAKR